MVTLLPLLGFLKDVTVTSCSLQIKNWNGYIVLISGLPKKVVGFQKNGTIKFTVVFP
jgi:hypothetical protein